jgi:hypothetical protein
MVDTPAIAEEIVAAMNGAPLPGDCVSGERACAGGGNASSERLRAWADRLDALGPGLLSFHRDDLADIAREMRQDEENCADDLMKRLRAEYEMRKAVEEEEAMDTRFDRLVDASLDALRDSDHWPLIDVLVSLSEATRHLLTDHCCAHGYEVATIARLTVTSCVERLAKLSAVLVEVAPTRHPMSFAKPCEVE